ncbi:MAG TPA: hypothetical protein VJN88_01615 [Ktedonobacterales bacterium]|nr:hypothetical protein [Ktedonobacterales bacterium]
MLSLSLIPQPIRPLPIALAHELEKSKPHSDRRDLLGRVYTAMTPAQKMLCHAELLECRAARRGAHEAVVAGQN